MKVAFSGCFWQSLYCVTKHRPWHLGRMNIKEGEQKLFVNSLSYFAKHSSDCFVDEVVGIVQEEFGEVEGVYMLSLFDEVEGRDDGDSPFSEGRGRSELVEF